MKLCRTIQRWLPCLFAVPLFAQPQIGGGTCNSSTLSGVYSLTLSGRDLDSAVFSNILQGTGTATFDGQSKVTFNLTNNTNKTPGQSQAWSGTYTMQANCLGTLSLTTGETASFILGSWNSGIDYFITGQDGTYSFLGSGNTQPTSSCSASSLNATYQFNGNGFPLSSGVLQGVNQISGLLTFNGSGGVTGNWVVSTSGTSTNITTPSPGTYSVTIGCTATASITDSAGNAYSLVFTITSANGSNFLISGASPKLMFVGSGRVL